ncbi:MAG: hypothetical protein QW051_02270 [Candidatus Aenigmatarchaeota archaeon]
MKTYFLVIEESDEIKGIKLYIYDYKGNVSEVVYFDLFKDEKGYYANIDDVTYNKMQGNLFNFEVVKI